MVYINVGANIVSLQYSLTNLQQYRCYIRSVPVGAHQIDLNLRVLDLFLLRSTLTSQQDGNIVSH